MLQLPILGHRQVEWQKTSAFSFSFVSKAEFLFPIALVPGHLGYPVHRRLHIAMYILIRMQPFYLRHMPLLDVIDI